MKRNSIRDEIMLVIPTPDNEGPTRQEVINSVEWAMQRVGPQGMESVKRKSIRDKLKKMIRNCEITEWANGSITRKRMFE